MLAAMTLRAVAETSSSARPSSWRMFQLFRIQLIHRKMPSLSQKPPRSSTPAHGARRMIHAGTGGTRCAHAHRSHVHAAASIGHSSDGESEPHGAYSASSTPRENMADTTANQPSGRRACSAPTGRRSVMGDCVIGRGSFLSFLRQRRRYCFADLLFLSCQKK